MELHQILTSFDTAFVWKYGDLGRGLGELYARAKQHQWDGAVHLDWSRDVDPESEIMPRGASLLELFEPVRRLDAGERRRLAHAELALLLSQFLHGEQGAMIVASQLCSAAPWMDAKRYAATQTMDEARHVEVFHRYVHDKLEWEMPIDPDARQLLDTTIRDSRWDIKYLGMQIVIEGMAMAAFGGMYQVCQEPLLKELLLRVMRDESRHVAFGVLSLRGFLEDLPAGERRDREDFLIWACELSRNRMAGSHGIAELMGWKQEALREAMLSSPVSRSVRGALFARIVPNLKRLGLLTPRVREALAGLELLQYESYDPEYQEKRLGLA